MNAKKQKGCFGCVPIILLIIIGVTAVVAYYAYNYVLRDNINASVTETKLYIPTGASFSQVVDSLQNQNLLINEASFLQVAKLKKYPDLVKPGRYIIKNNWNNIELIDYLRSGQQEPLNLIINNIRTKEELAGLVGRTLELDSLDLLQAFESQQIAEKYGFTTEEFPAMVLANTYEMYWTTNVDSFLDRMKKEYERFWNEERLQKAEALGLTPHEVITLASIVEEETKAPNELPIVAGLYLNRLKRGMLLQADPTVKFAVGDFTLRRVLNRHLIVDSPYNTYMYAGLPPGPIRIPELNAVNAVLNPKQHDYIYMSAKPDFSGEHAFAKTLSEHNINANRYRRALNERGIMR